MARVYADVNQQMPRSYWDYDSVNISWGVLENYEVVRKIGRQPWALTCARLERDPTGADAETQVGGNIRKYSRA